MKPLVHARTSARKYGGKPDDYLFIHNWMDHTKAHVADMRHRAILHNSWGIYLCEQVHGVYFTNSDGKQVSIRDVAEDHVLEDLGKIPSLEECLRGLPISDLLGARNRKKNRIIIAKPEYPEVD